jgi:hypothetical protein
LVLDLDINTIITIFPVSLIPISDVSDTHGHKSLKCSKFILPAFCQSALLHLKTSTSFAGETQGPYLSSAEGEGTLKPKDKKVV